jgi:hypothetical protein
MATLTFLKTTAVTITDERNTFRIVDESFDCQATYLAGDTIKSIDVLDEGTYTYDIELPNGDCIFGVSKDSVEVTYLTYN